MKLILEPAFPKFDYFSFILSPPCSLLVFLNAWAELLNAVFSLFIFSFFLNILFWIEFYSTEEFYENHQK